MAPVHIGVKERAEQVHIEGPVGGRELLGDPVHDGGVDPVRLGATLWRL
jgi:hypothetical protein